MRGVRLPLIATSLSILLLGGASLASEKCELAAGYLLEHEDELEFGVSIHRCVEYWRLEFEEFGGRLANGDPVWNVLELLEVPKVASDEIIVSQTCSVWRGRGQRNRGCCAAIRRGLVRAHPRCVEGRQGARSVEVT